MINFFIDESGNKCEKEKCLCVNINLKIDDVENWRSPEETDFENPFKSDREPKKIFLFEYLLKTFVEVKKEIIVRSENQKPFLFYIDNYENLHDSRKAVIDKKIQYLGNSSIWFRWCRNEAEKKNALLEFAYYDSLHLYDYVSAQENLDYNLRILKENKLLPGENNKNHYGFINPILYGDETKSKNTLIENYFEEDENGKNKNIDNVTYKFFNEFHDVTLRILVVDDKVGGSENSLCPKRQKGRVLNLEKDKNIKIELCGKDCDNVQQCKLKTLQQLMDAGEGTTKNLIFEGIGDKKDYFYWREKGIRTYFCPDLTMDFINEDFQTVDFLNEIAFKDGNDTDESPLFVKFVNSRKDTVSAHVGGEDSVNTNVQLVGVRDVRTALLLLSRYKFDMIFFDYLLDYKDSNSSERDYSIQFFDFLTGNVVEKTKISLNPQLSDEEKKTKLKRAKILEKFRREVLDNRGPLDRFWIMPITGFNETFITDLSRRGIPLIGSKWHINNGADPITTPWQFLDKLNRFIELQLTGSLFTLNKLLTFLQYTGEDLETKFRVEEKKKSQEPNTKISFGEFQAFLSAEYSSFFSKYGSKAVIKRDAVTTEDEKDWSSKSVFATYIWKNFYRNREGGSVTEEREKKQLFGLHSHMLGFYQMAAIMHNDRHGMLMLRESFRRLRYFIDVNRLVDETRAKIEKESFKKAVETIADCIDLVERGKNGSNL